MTVRQITDEVADMALGRAVAAVQKGGATITLGAVVQATLEVLEKHDIVELNGPVCDHRVKVRRRE